MLAILTLAASIALWPPLVVGQANRTVDDFSPQITYTPASAVTHGNLTGFDISKLYNGTISIINATELDSVNMTMKFTGSAVWLFLAKPQMNDSYGNAYNIYLDGEAVDDEGGFDLTTDAEYANLAYSNPSLHLGPHTVTLETPSGLNYFDYAVFTSNNPTPETTIPPIHSASSPASAAIGGASATGNTKPPIGSPSQPADALKKMSLLVPIVGAAAGVVVVAAGIVALLLCKRRRARAQRAKPQYGNGRVYGAQGAGGAQPPDMAMAQASDAMLLRAQSSQQSMSASTQEYNHLPNPYAAHGQPQNAYPPSQSTYPPQAYPPSGQQLAPYARSDYPAQPYGAPSPSSPQPSVYSPSSPYSSSHTHPEMAAAQYDPASNTLAYVPSAEQEPQLQRMLSEQRAVQAEYARPDPSQWGDEKAAMRRNASAGAPAAGPYVMNPGSPDNGTGPGVGRSWTTRTARGNGDAYPAPPPGAYEHAQARDAAALSTIAAEMVALRAHVARLEGHGQRVEEDGFGAPPAYD
ncbi:hypothetical protein GGX14DRAFT_462074 [Mycena pura]|uniref:Uncharacterized protein n=1 Tax=Mycena pura TaxID=153505 RepID=A0AAD6V9D0_9AGAR|nr:hypothetical protein GGX14DRAFT_462074 [Mycena pura]